jgi:hypothetical protein
MKDQLLSSHLLKAYPLVYTVVKDCKNYVKSIKLIPFIQKKVVGIPAIAVSLFPVFISVLTVTYLKFVIVRKGRT